MTDILNEIMLSLGDGLLYILELFFGWIKIPAFPESLAGSIDSFLNIIFDNLSLLGFFIRPTTLKVVVPLLIIIINFEYIYKIVIWIIKKIPFLGIQ